MTFLTVALLCAICAICGAECPDGWVRFQGSCYFFDHGATLTFVEAEHYCSQHYESRLVHVDTAVKNTFVKDFLGGMKGQRFWMGLTDDEVEGVWNWYGNGANLTFVDWAPGEPNDYGHNGEDCAVFEPSEGFQWNDVPCDHAHLYEPICELEDDSGEISVIG